MAWDWVAPTVTGLTSTAAIAATFLTARRSVITQAEVSRAAQQHETQLSALEHRRSAYGECLSALRRHETALVVSAPNEVVRRYEDDARSRLAMVELLGSEEVADVAREVLSRIGGWQEAEYHQLVLTMRRELRID